MSDKEAQRNVTQDHWTRKAVCGSGCPLEPDGHLRPLAIRFGPEQVYQIDKIKDVSRRAAEVGVWGIGMSV